MAPGLWTQRVLIRWRPEVRYYEQRWHLMTKLEEEGGLRAFRLRDSSERIEARLYDSWHQLSVGADRLELRLLHPTADRERILGAAQDVLEAVRPQAFGALSVSLQYVFPHEVEYVAARAAGLERLLGKSTLGDATLVDFAGLVDGTLDDPEAFVHAEFGVVQAEEIPVRLARVIGRVRGEEDGVSADLWEEESLPSVAFFCDSQWHLQDSLPQQDAMRELRRIWTDVVEKAGTVVGELHDRMLGSQGKGEV